MRQDGVVGAHSSWAPQHVPLVGSIHILDKIATMAKDRGTGLSHEN